MRRGQQQGNGAGVLVRPFAWINDGLLNARDLVKSIPIADYARAYHSNRRMVVISHHGLRCPSDRIPLALHTGYLARVGIMRRNR